MADEGFYGRMMFHGVNPGMQDRLLAMQQGGFGGAYTPQMNMNMDFTQMGINPVMSMGLNMALQPLLQGFEGMPVQMFPRQNVYDQMRSQNFWKQRMAVLQTTAGAEAAAYAQTATGAMTLMGAPPDANMQRMIGQGAGMFAEHISPMLAMMAPQWLDVLHGARGSPMAMAVQLQQAGQYMVDPRTGQLGLSDASIKSMNENTYKQLFGPGADLSAMKGFGAGQAGQMVNELQMRGMMPGPMSAIDNRDERLRRMATDVTGDGMRAVLTAMQTNQPEQFAKLARQSGAGGVSAAGQVDTMLNSPEVRDNITKITGMLNAPTIDAASAGFDKERVSSKIKNMTGVLAAMRDIFGDMGNTNAPIPELMRSLDQMTMGGTSGMSPQALEQTVRRMHATAIQTGVGPQAFFAQSLPAASAAAQHAGVDLRLAPQIAMAGAMGAAAFNETGRGSTPAWGAISSAGMDRQSQALTAGFMGSQSGNAMAALLRLADENKVDAGTDLGRFRAAVDAGQATFTDATGRQRSTTVNPGDVGGFAKQAGLDVSQAMQTVYQFQTNQEYFARHPNAAAVSKQIQWETDIKPRLQGAEAVIANGIRNIEGVGSDDDRNRKASAAMRDFSNRYRNMTHDDMDPAQRAKSFGDALAESLKGQGVTIDDRQRRQMGSTMFGMIDQIAQQSGYAGAANMADQFNETSIRRQALDTEKRDRTADMTQLMSGLGQNGFARRLFDTIRDSPKDWQTAGSKLLNIVGFADISDKLAGADPAKADNGIAAKLQLGALGLMQAELAKFDKDPTHFGKTAAEQDEQLKWYKLNIKAIQGDEAAVKEVKKQWAADGVDIGSGDSIKAARAKGTMGSGGQLLAVAVNLASQGGFASRAAEAGGMVGFSLGVKEVNQIVAGHDLLLEEMGKGKVKDDTAAVAAAGMDKLGASLRANDDITAALGAGSSKAVEEYLEAEEALKGKAAAGGTTIEQLMKSKDKEVQGLVARAAKAGDQLVAQMGKEAPSMSKEEREHTKGILQASRDREMGAASSVEAVIRHSAEAMGVDMKGVTKDEMADRVKEFGTGPEAVAKMRILEERTAQAAKIRSEGRFATKDEAAGAEKLNQLGEGAGRTLNTFENYWKATKELGAKPQAGEQPTGAGDRRPGLASKIALDGGTITILEAGKPDRKGSLHATGTVPT